MQEPKNKNFYFKPRKNNFEKDPEFKERRLKKVNLTSDKLTESFGGNSTKIKISVILFLIIAFFVFVIYKIFFTTLLKPKNTIHIFYLQ